MDKAQVFVKKQNDLGKKTNLTTQKQPIKRYFLLLKGYKQWASAFKQAQALMKQGFSDVEVVKGSFERDYSVFVSRYSDKKSTGKAFNRLKQMGLKNIKVHTNFISKDRYVVTVHTVEQVTESKKTKVQKTELQKTKPQNTKSKIESVSKAPEVVSAPEQCCQRHAQGNA